MVVPPALTIFPGEATATVAVIRSVVASTTSTALEVLSDTNSLAAGVGVTVGVGVDAAWLNVAFPGSQPEINIPPSNTNPAVITCLPYATLLAISINIIRTPIAGKLPMGRCCLIVQYRAGY